MSILPLRWMVCALCLLTLAASPCLSQQISVDAGSNPDPVARQFANALQADLKIRVPSGPPGNLRITVGPHALREALDSDPSVTTLAVFISSVELDAVLQGRDAPRQLGAIFTNPNPRDQVALAESLFGRSTFGVIQSPSTRTLVEKLSPRSIQAIDAPANADIDALLRQTSGISALIVLPDSTLNRTNVNHVVRTLYQRRAVLIGYSQTLTRVGALASIYVSPEALTGQIVETVARYARGEALPSKVLVADVSIAINEQLARSLNISIPSNTTILDLVRTRREERTP
jgi:hypothetical protein